MSLKWNWLARIIAFFLVLEVIIYFQYIVPDIKPLQHVQPARKLAQQAAELISPILAATKAIMKESPTAMPYHLGSGNEDESCIYQQSSAAPQVVAAVVVVTCCRAAYLEKTLSALLEVHSSDAANAAKFPLFVSQDGNNSEVTETLKTYMPPLRVIQHQEREKPKPMFNAKENLAYYRIANHYKLIFKTFFDCLNYPRLIILEDDMEVAIDFFTYFQRTATLLDRDSSLYVVSSWNDHGQQAHVADPYRLYRTDFFPGLGWLMPRRLWDEFRDIWPRAYWDDWMRERKQRKGRQSIYPEICRNYNFGEHGSSKGQYFRRYLKPIKLNIVPVPWANVKLEYLDANKYNADMASAPAAALLPGITAHTLLSRSFVTRHFDNLW